MDEDPQWRAMNSGELLHVSPTLDVTTTAILPGPPAHPLTLDQLGARARASQARPAP
jgi:glutamine amidotransferase